MGYVAREHAADGTALDLMVRGKASPARVAPTPSSLTATPDKDLPDGRDQVHQGP
ncbi:hypothetical protein ACFQU7_01785 [Pseudoroseomonas wenyumeiae]